MGWGLKIPGWVLLMALICGGAEPAAATGPHRSTQWFEKAPATDARGVALVVHGLNLNPDRMVNLIRVLNTNGVGALRLSLTGHGDNFMPVPGLDPDEARMETFKTVSHRIWSEDFMAAYRKSLQLKHQLKGPLFLVADSYGALLALEVSLNVPEVRFDRMVLFAPAVSLHKRNSIVRLLSPFPRLVIPSFSPGFYQANRGTPLAAYAVVFDTLARFQKSIGPKINIATLVFIDPEDELVSFEGLRQLVRKHQLDRWRIHRVTKEKGRAATRIHHLIIDPASVGQSTWNQMARAMLSHLLRPHAF
jgi:pimeloyl-ACP methyl ester carboxylesterase